MLPEVYLFVQIVTYTMYHNTGKALTSTIETNGSEKVQNCRVNKK